MRSIAPPHPTTYHAKPLVTDHVTGLQAAQAAEVRSAETALGIARKNLSLAEASLAQAEARLARVKGSK
jgi:hypothetical protein